jgi:hypothetical protein
MLLACRLAGLSALEAHYAGLGALTQSAVPRYSASPSDQRPQTPPAAAGGTAPSASRSLAPISAKKRARSSE